jgi:hypothetical protein
MLAHVTCAAVRLFVASMLLRQSTCSAVLDGSVCMLSGVLWMLLCLRVCCVGCCVCSCAAAYMAGCGRWRPGLARLVHIALMAARLMARWCL